MQKRRSVGSRPVVTQDPSVMQTLDTFSKHRATPSQIVEHRVNIREKYTQELSLIDALGSKSHAGSVTTLASRIITDFYDSEDMDRVTREVTGATATNFSRMKFFDSAAIEGLRQFFRASEGDTLAAIYTNTITRLEETKLAIAIEALLEAAQFGSGRACQSLLEANELGIITLDIEKIQALVTAQIYWYRELLGAEQLQCAECLPALTKNKKAWDAVRLKPDLFEDVLIEAYLDSGVKCQELIDENEHGTIVNLRPEELRRLVKNQINQYLAARQPGAIVSREEQQVPVLLDNQKVWAAFQQDAKESYNTLLAFFQALTLELDPSIATPEAVALTAENNPMVFKGYFEDRATQKTIKWQEIVPEDRAHADARQRVLLALFALRHQVFGADLKAVYAMRPAIDNKKETNKSADIAAAVALANATNELARRKAAIAQETAQQIHALEQAELGDRETVTVTYDRDGWESSIRKSKATDSYARLLSKLDEARRAGKDTTKYNQRISGLEGQPDFEAYKKRKAERDASITSLKQQEQDAYIRLDQSFESFKTSQEEARQTRTQELEALKNQEEAMIKALVETNPITECIRLAFLVIAQELTAYGILTSDWRALIAKSLAEDSHAYSTGVFAFDFTPATMLKKAKIKESLPLLILANAPAYMALLMLFRNGASSQDFWEKAQDRLFNFSGEVVDVDVAELLKDQFPLIFGAKNDSELAKKIVKALSHYKVESSSDPLLAMLNSNLLLALFISIKAIFPAEIDSSKAAELKAAAQLSCDRLYKIIRRPVNEIPSRLRNYLIMALVTLHDKAALGRLLSRDQSNPFYGVLLSAGLITANDFSFVPSKDSRLGTALMQLSNSTEHAVTAASIDNSYIVLTYLKRWLGIEAQTLLKQATLLSLKEAADRTSIEPLKTADDITAEFRAQMIARQEAGKETDVDILLLAFFNMYVAANYHAFCAEFAGKGGSLKPHESAWTHDMNSKVMRELRPAVSSKVTDDSGMRVSMRRSSLNRGVSFSQTGSSSALLPSEKLSVDESDNIGMTDLEVKDDAAVAAPALIQVAVLPESFAGKFEPVTASDRELSPPPPAVVEQEKSVTPSVDILSQTIIPVAPPAPPVANRPPPPPPPPRSSLVPPVTSSVENEQKSEAAVPPVTSFEEHKNSEAIAQPAPPPPPPPMARKKSVLFQGANGLGLADELRARAATLPSSAEGSSTIDQQLAAVAAAKDPSPTLARSAAVTTILARRKLIDDSQDGARDNSSDSGWSSSDAEDDSDASKPSVAGIFGGTSADSVARAAPLSSSPAPGVGGNG